MELFKYKRLRFHMFHPSFSHGSDTNGRGLHPSVPTKAVVQARPWSTSFRRSKLATTRINLCGPRFTEINYSTPLYSIYTKDQCKNLRHKITPAKQTALIWVFTINFSSSKTILLPRKKQVRLVSVEAERPNHPSRRGGQPARGAPP